MLEDRLLEASARRDASRRGGGRFAAGIFRRGIFRSGFISHAVLNLLWEISHPHAVSRPWVGGDCCYLWTRLLSIILHPCKKCSKPHAKFAGVHAYSDEKRTITRSPITDSDANISLFQHSRKGTTDFCSGNCWTRHFAKFRSGFLSHSGLEITWEISHEFETRNIPRRNIPAGKPPPPPPPVQGWGGFVVGTISFRAPPILVRCHGMRETSPPLTLGSPSR